jgi:hypothetical protein
MLKPGSMARSILGRKALFSKAIILFCFTYVQQTYKEKTALLA